MTHSLALVLQNPAIWRGGDCAPEPAAIASGFPALDAVLPGSGWPTGALTEILLAREGIGEISLTLPALACLQAGHRDIVWIAPPHVPYAPALAAAGLDLSRFIFVRCATATDQLWAYEQALRAPECGAAFAWLATPDDRVLRRLQVAARDGGTWGVLWRRPGQHAVAAAAPLRLALAPQEGQLAVQVLKRRGGEVVHPILLDVHSAVHSLGASRSGIATLTRSDPRTSTGRWN
ncbi:MAG: translesion DNA synthesis-associated protein ImuA [Betaproteobacteria bacterium]